MRADDDVQRATADVAFLRDLLSRVQRRIDPHAFHFVLWGAIVAVWYPLSTWLLARGDSTAATVLGASALGLGFVASLLLERRLGGRGRVVGEDASVGRRVGQATAGNLIAAAVVSAVGPATGFLEGSRVPVVWGLAYASIAFHVGLVYSREFVWSGAFIFVGACASMALGDRCGYLLGPVMGLGMVVPGLVAERRVRRLRAQDAIGADAPA